MSALPVAAEGAASAGMPRERRRFDLARAAAYFQAAPIAFVFLCVLAFPIVAIVVVSFFDCDSV
jgi:ABC-type sugar transport system permease subunit